MLLMKLILEIFITLYTVFSCIMKHGNVTLHHAHPHASFKNLFLGYKIKQTYTCVTSCVAVPLLCKT